MARDGTSRPSAGTPSSPALTDRRPGVLRQVPELNPEEYLNNDLKGREP